ncbi:hypothetical protein ACJIZ3_011095 [Penstemon smallii]|uniref:Exonuclease domain-containing protein n=1 Tax=Penstemon smallii TaxID=265156 RepID=A0ABD3UMD9_9LAMI
MATWRLPLLRRTPYPYSPPPPFFSYSTTSHKPQIRRKFVKCMEESTSSTLTQSQIPKTSTWKPMCLYYTQCKCTKMDDPLHIDKFRHSCSVESVSGLRNQLQAQEFDYFLVLDLEGKVEILEFPVLLFDVKTMDVVDVFHSVWHDTAIKFDEVIEQFEDWLNKHRLWKKEQGGYLNQAAFVTCGNWDLKTKIPHQCEVSEMKLPPYFMEWINLKDIYLNFYNRRAPGMLSMMRGLQMKPFGSHHLGIDDSKNIARVLQYMLTDGALVQVTARRVPGSPDKVKFLLENRIR